MREEKRFDPITGREELHIYCTAAEGREHEAANPGLEDKVVLVYHVDPMEHCDPYGYRRNGRAIKAAWDQFLAVVDGCGYYVYPDIKSLSICEPDLINSVMHLDIPRGEADDDMVLEAVEKKTA